MGEQSIFGYKLERGRPFEWNHKGWLEGCHVDDVGEGRGRTF